MKLIFLDGNYEQDEDIILKNIDSKEDKIVFLYAGREALCDYLEGLKEHGLSNKNLFKLNICKEIDPIRVTYNYKGRKTECSKFSELLNVLKTDVSSEVVVHDEDHVQLSNIIQQFVYLQMPLNKIHVLTEADEKNYRKTKSFEKNIEVHTENVKKALSDIQWNGDAECKEIYNEVRGALNSITEYLADAKDNELKIAVAASKKSGKSVVVNGMLGYELAPTSMELATPNNCIYTEAKNGFCLKYEGKKEEFDDSGLMKKRIKKLFKDAENNVDGFGIADMEIEYVPNAKNRGLSSYTIFDTPGPDLAGATDHKEAANRAIKETDVIVFCIDYSKHLTDTEESYLKEVYDILREKKKYYSLIVTVNKLDDRYTSEGDKNIVRILDFIREKLIKIDDSFRDIIVFGTSALTYFDCLEIERIPESSEFGKNCSYSASIVDYLDGEHELSDEETQALTFVQNQLNNIRNFDGVKIKNISDLKGLSGMPNLLSYIEYVAGGKARIEKVNNLMFKIDEEYTRIQNLFQWQQLEEGLAENQEKMDVAEKILTRFQDEITDIYQDDSRDLYEMKLADNLESTSLKQLCEQRSAKIEDVKDLCIEKYISGALDAEKIRNYIFANITKAKFEDAVEKLFKKSTITRRVTDYQGRTSNKKIIKEGDLVGEIVKLARGLADDTSKVISNKLADCAASLPREIQNIREDLQNLVNNRLDKLREAIDRCKLDLQNDCKMDFDLATPVFSYEFKGNDTQKNWVDLKLYETNIQKRLTRFYMINFLMI